MFKFFCLWMKVLCLRLEYSKQNINSPKLWKHWKIQVNYTNELLLCIFHFCDMIQVYPPAENKNKLRLLKFIENNHCCDSPVKRCNIFFWRVVIANLTFWLFPQCIFLYGKRTDRFIVIAWICIRLYCKLLNKCLESKAEKLYMPSSWHLILTQVSLKHKAKWILKIRFSSYWLNKNEICGLTDRKEIVENFTNYS